MNIKKIDEKLHNWEHNLVISGEKLIHHEIFWVGVIIAAVIAFFLIAMMLTPNSPPPKDIFYTPVGPIY